VCVCGVCGVCGVCVCVWGVCVVCVWCVGCVVCEYVRVRACSLSTLNHMTDLMTLIFILLMPMPFYMPSQNCKKNY
jgi:hypothetical protein